VVLLPEVKRLREPAERIEFFEKMEAGFARHARVTTLVTGLSGIYLVHSLGAWERFAELQYWWMHAMVLVWGVFTLMLFVLEPLWLHRWFRERAQRDPDGTLATITRLHWLLLLASLTTVAGAAAGSHGWSFGR
jgi:Kef-type K+ transport system membrane component KefB